MVTLPRAPWEELDLNPVHHIGDSIKAYDVPAESTNPSVRKALRVNPFKTSFTGFGVPRRTMPTSVYINAMA